MTPSGIDYRRKNLAVQRMKSQLQLIQPRTRDSLQLSPRPIILRSSNSELNLMISGYGSSRASVVNINFPD